MRNVYALCLAASLFGLAFAALLPSAAPTAAARPPKAPGPPKPPKVHKTPKPSRAHRTAKHAKAHKASKLAKGVKPTRRHQQKMRKTHVRPQNATSKRHREPQKKSNAQLAQALRALKASHAVLGKADHDYGGHRKAAQRDIGQAEKSLEAALGSRGGQEKGVGPAQARPLAPRAAG